MDWLLLIYTIYERTCEYLFTWPCNGLVSQSLCAQWPHDHEKAVTELNKGNNPNFIKDFKIIIQKRYFSGMFFSKARTCKSYNTGTDSPFPEFTMLFLF